MTLKIFPLLGFALLSGGLSHAQKSAEILAKHFEASTQDFWDEVHHVAFDGVWFMNDRKIPFDLFAKKSGKVLIRGTWEDQNYVEAYDGNTAWAIAPWKGMKKAEELEGINALLIKNLVDFGSPISRDAQLTYRGSITENDIPVFWLREQLPNGHIDYFIDRDNYLLRKKNIIIEIDGKVHELLKIYDQFRGYGAVIFPSLLVIKTKETEREYLFDKTIIGEGIPNSAFVKPDE